MIRGEDIASARLWLRPLDETVLDHLIDGRLGEAEARLGAAVPPAWAAANRDLFMMRRDNLADAAYRPWGLRALVSQDSGVVVGHAGFHTTPGPAYLAPYAAEAVEMGYAVEPEHRSRGLATETLNALMNFAAAQGVRRFVLSIAPDNAPSVAMAERAGFVRVGEYIDEIDGLEEVWLKDETLEPRP